MSRTGRLLRPYVTLFGLGIAWCMLFGLLFGIPEPKGNDENAYLLAADTFIRGRLTNPTPAGWEHFETFHVLLQPTYMAKYPPGQGLILALGKLLSGHFIVGAWISIGLMAASAYYLLAARLSARWCWLGAATAILLLGGAEYWAQSYWGGAMAAAGGNVWFGSLLRFRDRPRLSLAFAAGFGAAVLALTRPLEGLVAVTVASIWLLAETLRTSSGSRQFLTWMFGVCLVVVPVLGWHGYYNFRVTGDALLMPYQAYEREYALVPNLLVSPDPEITRSYRNAEIERLYLEWGRERREQLRRPAEFLRTRFAKLGWAGLHFAGPFLLLFGRLRFKDVRSRLHGVGAPALAVTGLVALSMGAYPHYLAPVAGLYLLAGVVCLKAALSDRSRTWARALAVICFWLLGAQVLYASHDRPWMRQQEWVQERKVIAQRLANTGERHLVLVQYGSDHNVHQEWVYNGADFEDAPVLWARSMGPEADARLAQTYDSRVTWRLYATSGDGRGPLLEALSPLGS